jgi:hypothetical protein
MNLTVAITFSKIFFVAFNSGGRNSFYRWQQDPTFGDFCPPHPNPPPRRGEGRVGVMLLEIFMQRLGEVRKGRVSQGSLALFWAKPNKPNKTKK